MLPSLLQMVDLLKTSRTVAVTVSPPHPDGSPRQGCHLAPGCSYAFGGFEGDYENVNGEGEKVVGVGAGAVQAPSNGKMRYERSLSPPRFVQYRKVRAKFIQNPMATFFILMNCFCNMQRFLKKQRFCKYCSPFRLLILHYNIAFYLL